MKSISLVVVVLLLGVASAEIKNKGWWKNAVFYQVYPRSFMDSDDDGMGDLKGITKKLEHFKDIGVTAIWLSPINQSPGVDNGYDISDFRQIDKLFGTLDDFKELIKESKKLDLKVVLDLVPNHTSDQHIWFQESINKTGKYKDYYIWTDCLLKSNTSDERILPNNWLSVFNGTAWTYNKEREQCYFRQFYPQQPDLNYRNKDVQEEMKAIIKYWLDIGLDGFRIDAVPHLFEEQNLSKNEELIQPPVPNTRPGDHATLNHTLTKDQPETYKLIKSWRDFVDDYASSTNTDEKVLLTEAYTTWEKTLEYYNHGSNVPFNFKFITDADAKSTASHFKEIIDRWMSEKPKDGIANWVMGNHDRVRLATRYPGREDHLVMLEMILPGIAVSYYGEEIGMQDYTSLGTVFNSTKSDFRDGCRTPFQWDASKNAGFSNANSTWLPVNPNYVTLNLAKQKNDSESHYKMYTSLLKLRQTDVLKNGGLNTVVLSNSVLAVIRNNTNETVALLMNFNQDSQVQVNLANLVYEKEPELKLQSVGAGVKSTSVNLFAVDVPKGAAIVISSVSAAPTIALSVFALLPLLFHFYRL